MNDLDKLKLKKTYWFWKKKKSYILLIEIFKLNKIKLEQLH